jgi:glycosyltransferase involved in cell wall biosynthesis
MLPAFAEAMSLPCSSREGWLSGAFERILREKAVWDDVPDETGPTGIAPENIPGSGLSSDTGFIDAAGANAALAAAADAAAVQLRSRRMQTIDLGVCFPVPPSLADCREEISDVVFYGFEEDTAHPENYDARLETRFAAILEDFKPEIVHIFGTEFPHTLAMVRAFGDPGHTLIGIQGLCTSIAGAYMAGLPYPVRNRVTFRDWYRKDSLKDQKHKFELRAVNEAEALQHTGHVTGRTTFDRDVTDEINPGAVYHPMNETLRSCFYKGRWDPDECEPHSIFLSQGDYPLKGFHFMLQAMPLILKKFPDAHLYVAGISVIGNVGGVLREKKSVPEPFWITSYGMYLKKLIRKGHLKGHVTMLGRLTAEQIKDRYLSSNVFVCPSVMENSPNSVCEAMLLGMPVVASKVGGIPDLLCDGEDGILFPPEQVEELAEGVETLFLDGELAAALGTHARATAKMTHNRDINYKRLLEIYRSML